MADHGWLIQAERALSDAGGAFLGFTAKGHRKWRIGKEQIILSDPAKHGLMGDHRARQNAEAQIKRAIKKYGKFDLTAPINGRPSDQAGVADPSAIPAPPDPPPLPPIVMQVMGLAGTTRELLCPREGCPKPGPFKNRHVYAHHVRFMHPKPGQAKIGRPPKFEVPGRRLRELRQRLMAHVAMIDALLPEVDAMQTHLAAMAEAFRRG